MQRTLANAAEVIAETQSLRYERYTLLKRLTDP